MRGAGETRRGLNSARYCRSWQTSQRRTKLLRRTPATVKARALIAPSARVRERDVLVGLMRKTSTAKGQLPRRALTGDVQVAVASRALAEEIEGVEAVIVVAAVAVESRAVAAEVEEVEEEVEGVEEEVAVEIRAVAEEIEEVAVEEAEAANVGVVMIAAVVGVIGALRP